MPRRKSVRSDLRIILHGLLDIACNPNRTIFVALYSQQEWQVEADAILFCIAYSDGSVQHVEIDEMTTTPNGYAISFKPGSILASYESNEDSCKLVFSEHSIQGPGHVDLHKLKTSDFSIALRDGKVRPKPWTTTVDYATMRWLSTLTYDYQTPLDSPAEVASLLAHMAQVRELIDNLEVSNQIKRGYNRLVPKYLLHIMLQSASDWDVASAQADIAPETLRSLAARLHADVVPLFEAVNLV